MHARRKEKKKMKIITKKQGEKIAEQMTIQLKILLKSHGVTPKEKHLMTYKNKLLKSLGVKIK